MNPDRLIASIALVIAVVALAVAAWALTDNERDACARLADLGTGIGTDRAFNAAEVNDSLLRDCITD